MVNIHAIPKSPPVDIIKWAVDSDIKIDGKSFIPTRIPQLLEPMQAMIDPKIRIGTFCKPVQSGGSSVGEIVSAFWLSFYHGLLQENWQNDLKAKERWQTRILRMLRSCPDLKWAGGIYDEKICSARFINSMLIVQGVAADGALDSETVPLMINEEVHLWPAGTLDKARRRQTLVWNPKALDISNASNEGDQMHAAYESGTMKVWEVLCPGCKQYHEMQFRFDEKRSDLGGLRFDTDAGRSAGGKYNFSKLAPTIRYQMPCGFVVHDTPAERRALVGRYRQTNDGALESHASWTYEGVSVTEIRWLDLVEEWLKACRAKNAGDLAPLEKFVKERECRFWGERSIPFSGMVVVNNSLKQSREGLPGRIARFWFADKQRGYKAKGELRHYWLVIRDVMSNCDSQLVYEGMVQTDNDLIARLGEHECILQAGAVDCTWDRDNVLEFCYRSGCNAQTTSAQDRLFFHPLEKIYRNYSPPDALCKQLKVPPKYPYVLVGSDYKPNPQESLHWSVHRIAHIKLLYFLRGHQETVKRNNGIEFIKWEVPGDVSEEYKRQLESWEFTTKKKPGTNQTIEICRQRFQDDHMLMCEAGIANLMSMAPHPDYPQLSILSVRLAQLGISEAIIGQTEIKE